MRLLTALSVFILSMTPAFAHGDTNPHIHSYIVWALSLGLVAILALRFVRK